jgi:hypothetical protein
MRRGAEEVLVVGFAKKLAGMDAGASMDDHVPPGGGDAV